MREANTGKRYYDPMEEEIKTLEQKYLSGGGEEPARFRLVARGRDM